MMTSFKPTTLLHRATTPPAGTTKDVPLHPQDDILAARRQCTAQASCKRGIPHRGYTAIGAAPSAEGMTSLGPISGAAAWWWGVGSAGGAAESTGGVAGGGAGASGSAA